MSSNATKECDDGNVVNGDGCSNTCTIESGYTCSSDSSRKPASFCISIGYSTTLNALIKDPSSNSLTAYL
jgi:cysteine-rich repeat protein